jgi:acyl carrier protein
MNSQEIQTRLHKVYLEVLDLPEFGMEPSLQVGDIEAWDSFAHITLMLGIEAEFGVEFDSDEIGLLRSVGQILEALQGRLANTGS